MTSIMIGYNKPTHGNFYWDGYTWGVWFRDGSTSILNATKDFGITTQGPSPTPYTVPANTVEYSDWWTTTGGETVRRVVTTTYTDRSLAGYKAYSNISGNFGAQYSPQFVTVATQTAYAATSLAAKQACVALIQALLPASIIDLIWGYGFNLEAYNYTTDKFRWYYDPSNYLLVTPASTLVTPVSVTLYYLDTQIVWTYEIV